MSKVGLTCFYFGLVMLLQVVSTVLGFILSRRNPKSILSGKRRKKRSVASQDAWDYINIKTGRFLFLGGVVCVILSAEFCIMAVALDWIITYPLLAICVPYGLFAALLIGTVVYVTLNKQKSKPARRPKKV